MAFSNITKAAAAIATAATAVPLRVLASSAALDAALEVGGAAGLGGAQQDETLTVVAGRIINQFLGFAGVIVVVLFIYGGFLWMTAGGSEEKVSKGKKYITNAVIGLIIIFAAYAITNFVVTSVLSSTSA